jgi:RNA polymerase sigma-70 factor (ECF subfamily)
MADKEERFDELYRHNYRMIERYVRRRVDDPTVSDVVAEIFTVAWRRINEVPTTDAKLWLFAVGRNVVANHVRGSGRAYRLTEKVAANTARFAEDHADDVAERLTVAAAFDRLGPGDQEVLRLVAWEGLTLRQAAAVLGCGVAAVAMRLNRARRRLRRSLLLPEPATRPTDLTRKGQGR